MKKTMTIFSAALLAAAFFLSAAHAQMPEKGAKNTMTLPNGEEVCDHHGRNWDCWAEKIWRLERSWPIRWSWR